MTQDEFEEKYHYKIVRPVGNLYEDIPKKEYIATSALIGEDESIFAIKATDYNTKNKHWFTFHIYKADFNVAMSDFEIIGDGYEKYIKRPRGRIPKDTEGWLLVNEPECGWKIAVCQCGGWFHKMDRLAPYHMEYNWCPKCEYPLKPK